ncbi:MAG: hydantoinase/oxoprolinase family protein [Vicinamibacterales bacterium]
MARSAVVGWDIGGSNTKAVRVRAGRVEVVRAVAFEVREAPGALAQVLRDLAGTLAVGPGDWHAVTMTAELSRTFRTKREGVAAVLAAIEEAVGPAPIRVFTVDGRFVEVAEARHAPLAVAAANWAATAHLVASHHPDALLVDIGTTSTDIVAIVGGAVCAMGTTDPERLLSGTLVYTGALRTPVEAVVRQVPLWQGMAGVAAEGFALTGDVHLWRGDLAAEAYTVPTPDGRPVTRAAAGERIARMVCGDTEMLHAPDIDGIAAAVADAQVAQVAAALDGVRARHPGLRVAVVTGLGGFIGERAARAAGLEVVALADHLGAAGARCAPAAAVALLLCDGLGGEDA